jgi:hypothetical protein
VWRKRKAAFWCDLLPVSKRFCILKFGFGFVIGFVCVSITIVATVVVLTKHILFVSLFVKFLTFRSCFSSLLSLFSIKVNAL